MCELSQTYGYAKGLFHLLKLTHNKSEPTWLRNNLIILAILNIGKYIAVDNAIILDTFARSNRKYSFKIGQ